MRIYLVAGESSGDLHGANLMKALIKNYPNAEFRFFGGDKMQTVGGTLVSHYNQRAFMGLLDVIKNIRTITKFIKLCVADISEWKPDFIVFVDNPGFNLRVAKQTRSLGIKQFYYIAPKVWAWNQKRVFKLKEVVDHLFCILPFEINFFKKFGVPATYVGNPLMDEISEFNFNNQFLIDHNIEAENIALLPGSRRQEIEKILPEMLKVCKYFKDYQFIIAATPDFELNYYQQFITQLDNVKIVFSDTYNILKYSKAALVTSGTATLETGLIGTPQIVCYKTNGLTYHLGKYLIKVKYISLVNLILNKAAVPELIQSELTAMELKKRLSKLVTNNAKERNKMLENYKELRALVGGPGASERTAGELFQIMQ